MCVCVCVRVCVCKWVSDWVLNWLLVCVCESVKLASHRLTHAHTTHKSSSSTMATVACVCVCVCVCVKVGGARVRVRVRVSDARRDLRARSREWSHLRDTVLFSFSQKSCQCLTAHNVSVGTVCYSHSTHRSSSCMMAICHLCVCVCGCV